MAWQKIRIDIPTELKPRAREELGDLIIEHIFDRTDRGLDKEGKKFPGYSETYQKSLDFANAGKSPGNVNLQLSGDMLAAMKLISHKSGSLIIGFDNGTPENGKAEGNILGTYGQDSPIRGKRRDFLGIQTRKLKELIDYVRPDKKS